MVKHTQSVFGHFVELAFKELIEMAYSWKYLIR